jgi:hypothetical protein
MTTVVDHLTQVLDKYDNSLEFLRDRLGNPVLLYFLLGIGVLLVCLMLKPPFALSHTHDSKNPWKSTTSISWINCVVAALILVVAACLTDTFFMR